MTHNFYEIQSINTSHLWIIKKVYNCTSVKIHVYHKHSSNIPYYHRHLTTYSVKKAVLLIKKHDIYILNS